MEDQIKKIIKEKKCFSAILDEFSILMAKSGLATLSFNHNGKALELTALLDGKYIYKIDNVDVIRTLFKNELGYDGAWL